MKRSIFKKTAIALIIALVAFAGCDDKTEDTPPITIDDAAKTQTAFADQTTLTGGITFTATAAWTATAAEGTAKAGTVAWLTISPDHGEAGTHTVNITLEPNATGADRSATVTVTSGGVSVSIAITQKSTKKDGTPYEQITVENGAALAQTVFADETQGESITFATAGAWTSSISPEGATSWVSITPGHGDAAGTYAAAIAFANNTSGKERSATITIACGGKEVAVSVTQAATKKDGTLYEFDVYVAGVYPDGKNILWKNDIAQYHDLNNAARAKSVYVAGNDVYVAGYERASPENSNGIAKLWVNGKAQTLSSNTNLNARANSVCVSGNDVYVVMHESELIEVGWKTTSKLWKNGAVIKSLQNYSGNGGCYSEGDRALCISGSDVYVAGRVETPDGYDFYESVATYWKNGEAHSLTGGTSAYSVYVSGNDVYVTGTDGDNAVYWKNGVVQKLPNPSNATWGNVCAVYAVDTDVYAAGYVWINGGMITKPALWKNGMIQDVNIPDGEICSMYGVGTDVYMTGNTYNGSMFLYKNGKSMRWNMEYNASAGYSVFVKERE